MSMLAKKMFLPCLIRKMKDNGVDDSIRVILGQSTRGLGIYSTVPTVKSIDISTRRICRDNMYSALFAKGMVFVYGWIDDSVATYIGDQLLYLKKVIVKPRSPINMIINSPGADGSAVLMLCDVMDYVQFPIVTHCYGSALGNASLILAAGSNKYRRARQNAIISAATHLAYTPKFKLDPVQNEAAAKTTREMIHSRYATYCERSTKAIEEELKVHQYMSADQAMLFGLIDVIGRNNA